MVIINALGTNIKKLRMGMNLSQIEFSNLLGLSQTSVVHYEKGTRQPSIDTLIQMGTLFNVTIDNLIGAKITNNEKVSLEKIKLEIPILAEFLLNKEVSRFLEYYSRYIEDKYSIEVVLYQVLQPILYHIGNLWERGEIDEVDEHYATNIIRKVLNHLSYNESSKIKTKKIVSFAISTEKHTIGIEMVNTYLESLGFQSIFLGSNIPYSSIFKVLNDVKPDYVFISITLESYLNNLSKLIKELVERYGTLFKIVIGGQGVMYKEYQFEYKNVYVVRSNKELHKILDY